MGQEASLREARGQLSCRDEEVRSMVTLVTASNTCPLLQVARLRRDLAAARQEKVMVETVGSDRDKQVHQVSQRERNFDRCLC